MAQIKSNGSSHVGRRAIDSKVSLGLKSAPKMRPIALTGSGVSAGWTVALVIRILLYEQLGALLPLCTQQAGKDYTEECRGYRFKTRVTVGETSS